MQSKIDFSRNVDTYYSAVCDRPQNGWCSDNQSKERVAKGGPKKVICVVVEMYNQTMAETYLVQFFRFRYTSGDIASRAMGSTSRDVDGRRATTIPISTAYLTTPSLVLVYTSPISATPIIDLPKPNLPPPQTIQ